MRFLNTQLVNVLRRQCITQTPVLTQREGSWLMTRCLKTLLLSSSPPCRALSTAQRLRKEASQPSTDKLDLDLWKSVMKSGDDSAVVTQSEESAEASPLGAMRDLVEMWRQAGKLVPENMTEEELQTLEELSTKSSRKKYLKYLALKEGHKKARKKKQEKKKQERAEDAKGSGEDEEEDGSRMKNTFLLQFWQRSIDALYNWRAAQAMQFGQSLVFDMSYDRYMTRREIENTVSQLLECEGWNRRALDPFHLHFCNLKVEAAYHKELIKRYSGAWDRLLVSATDRPHQEVFPREKLVYLTADSPHVLKTFDHDKVYIVGAMVDKSIQTGLSLANAKRLNLATARLPLDEYLLWDSGAKNLTLDQVIRILLTIKDTGSWEKALRFVPSRKHEGFYKPQQSEHKHWGKAEARRDNSRTQAAFVRHQAFNPKMQQTLLKDSRSGETAGKSKGKKNWWEEED
ncbi:Mitochondrial ribonuclease P protein 1 [Acipenser ruthenus]|uniref:tRNA methyltransferase 10 homolog C n=1 Tax=Acipenser ruthenus TaxID=7906 RepID=A0A444UA23_ACIRT|nr:Mitochondrial ribonuclease P protein 1 [Acipenser ruthenus]